MTHRKSQLTLTHYFDFHLPKYDVFSNLSVLKKKIGQLMLSSDGQTDQNKVLITKLI